MIYPVTERLDDVTTLTRGRTGITEGLAEEEDRLIQGVMMTVDGVMTMMMRRMRKRKLNVRKNTQFMMMLVTDDQGQGGARTQDDRDDTLDVESLECPITSAR